MLQTLSAVNNPLVRKPSAGPASGLSLVPKDSVQISGSDPTRSPRKPTGTPARPPGRSKDAPPGSKWTILVYSAADNNLKDYLIQNLVDAQKVGSSDNLNVVSQLDLGGSDGASRLYIQHSDKPTLDAVTVQKIGDTDMADPKTLSDFVQWGVKTYPADHYMLIISDHGDGWRGAVEDDSAGTWMSLPKIDQALQDAQQKSGTKLDIVGFDACLMASSEVAHQLKGDANYLVVSEETEGANGWPYTKVLSGDTLKALNQALLMKINMTPAEFAQYVVKSATTVQGDLPTLAAYDTSKVDPVTTSVTNLTQAILNADDPTTKALVADAQATQQFYDTRDLFDFCNRVNGDAAITDDKLKKAAQDVMAAIPGLAIAEQHSDQYPNAHGVSINLGGWSFAPTQDYRDLPFTQATHFDQALDKLDKANSGSSGH